MKVFFYLVPRQTASKVDMFQDEGGTTLQKTKIGRKTSNIYRPLLSMSTGKLKTGLDEMVENPFKDDPKEKIKAGFEPYILGKERVKLQHLLEYKHGVPVDHYTSLPLKSEVYGIPEKEEGLKVPYFQRQGFQVKISDTGLMLDTSKPEDELIYYFLKASDKCASTREAANPMTHEYYIGAENEGEDKVFSKTEVIDKAVAKLVTGEISDDYKVKISKVLGLAKKEVSPKKAHMNLRTYITKETKDQLSNVKKFLSLVESLESPKEREKLEAKALLEDLIAYRIVTSTSDIYEWKSKGINIGMNKASALDYLLNPHKQDEVEELTRELNNKK
jgi:hypothetical protein